MTEKIKTDGKIWKNGIHQIKTRRKILGGL
jgi:hypothetical protein